MQVAKLQSSQVHEASESIADELRQFVGDPQFPCVGAKAALRRGQLDITVVDDIRNAASDRRMTQSLQCFAERNNGDRMFVSKAFVFADAIKLDEVVFETHLWQRLAGMHAIDLENYRWDPNVASDPDSPHFSMSIGGRGFFVVGLHPGASRLARRFAYPTMIFNLQEQFEQLREEQRYETIRAKTLERDVALAGSINPMLERHGEGSAAPQYSGRHVGKEWRCPFRAAGR